jgi:hypothetical protein
MTDRKKAGRGPEITAFSVKDFTTKGGRKESAWKRIGMALQHSDEMGFEVKLKEYPAPDCRLERQAWSRFSTSAKGSRNGRRRSAVWDVQE